MKETIKLFIVKEGRKLLNYFNKGMNLLNLFKKEKIKYKIFLIKILCLKIKKKWNYYTLIR